MKISRVTYEQLFTGSEPYTNAKIMAEAILEEGDDPKVAFKAIKEEVQHQGRLYKSGKEGNPNGHAKNLVASNDMGL